MAINILSNSFLHVSLWMEAFKTVVYLLNRTPTKATSNTPFKLWIDKKPSLRHLHGCLAKARIYNLLEKKLDFKIISSCFIGYLENSKVYRFYCLIYSTKIVETSNDKFIENCEINERENHEIYSFMKLGCKSYYCFQRSYYSYHYRII